MSFGERSELTMECDRVKLFNDVVLYSLMFNIQKRRTCEQDLSLKASS